MTVEQLKLTTGLSVCGLAVLCVAVGPLAADSGANSTIYGCYGQKHGQLRVVASLQDCTRGERPISWNVTGPMGIQGPSGPAGPPGPASTTGAVTLPLIATEYITGSIIDVTNLAQNGYGVRGSGTGSGVFGEGYSAGVTGQGYTSGVSGMATGSSSQGGYFSSLGGHGNGVVGVSVNTRLPGIGVIGQGPDATFLGPVTPLQLIPGIGVSGSGYYGVVGIGRDAFTPQIDTVFGELPLQGTGVHGEGYIGVYGKSDTGYAGYFDGGVHVNGNLTSTVISQSSDRALKHNFAHVDGHAVLRRLAKIPIHTWNYRSEPASVRHIGPTAQEFFRAFGVGADDRHIATVDEGGVALIAIQALYQMSLDKDRQIEALTAQLNSLTSEVDRLKKH